MVLGLLIIATVACNDKLDLQPQQSLSTREALSDINGIETAVNGAYDAMQAVGYYGRNFLVVPEAAGDNILVALDNSGRFLTEARYLSTAENTQGGIWAIGYNVIARANNVINNIENVTDGSQEQKDNLLGQAYFLRALVHFDLVRIFGAPYLKDNGSRPGVPVILQTEIGEPGRNTVAEVYDQVIADLNQASNLLPDTDAPFFATRLAALALLSRVHLYKGDNAAAESAATEVINSGRFQLIPRGDYTSSWERDGTVEEIFTLRFLNIESSGADNLGSIYIDEGYGDLRPSQDILDLLAPNDIRRNLIREIGGDQYQYKFPGIQGVPGLASPKILRLSEVYLNRAEARAKLGNDAGAVSDLNRIRQRAGLSAIAPTGAQLLDEVLIERRRELMFEGHRSFDIFRNGRDMVRIECNTPQGVNCTVPFNSHLITFPIPQTEVDANENMVQNEGY